MRTEAAKTYKNVAFSGCFSANRAELTEPYRK
jgi:hypothetical protein